MSAPDAMVPPALSPRHPHILITAGPTHEPIDAVRFIGNRSSGRLGTLLAQAAAARAWQVTLLLGPTAVVAPDDSTIRLRRFRTAADLEHLLTEEFPVGPGGPVDVLVMAAAVADYRPSVPADQVRSGKLRRAGGPLTLTLDPTPDLLAACAARRRPGQLIVGFALEPRDRLAASAREKIARKRIDLIVANPLETMEAQDIEAALVAADGSEQPAQGRLSKEAFATWLLDQLHARSAPMRR